MYKQTDKVIRFLNKKYIRIFGRAKALVSFDEINVLSYSHEIYDELENITEKAYLSLAKHVYKKHSKSRKTDIVELWLLGVLGEYNPVTKYVYLHEVDRKRARFAEALIASPTKAKEVDVSLRYWSAMARQYANEITDAAMLQAYKDDGVTKVEWITEEDERRCTTCAKRHGAIYDIDKVPPKPHIGCRCYLLPYKRRAK